MTRLIKWLVGFALILGLIYLALVAVTGSKMRDIAEQQVAASTEQEPGVEARIEWHETGFWRSSGVLTVNIEDPAMELVHTINLRHGALHAAISGEASAVLDDFDINAQLFSAQPLTLDGRVGLTGMSLTYEIPSIHYQDTALGSEVTSSPFAIDLVLRDHDQHTQFNVDWIEVRSNTQGVSGIDRLEGLHMTAQTSLSDDDGRFEHGITKFGFDAYVSQRDGAQVSMVEGASIDTEMQREGDDVTVQSRMEVAEYEMYGIRGGLTVALHTTAMPLASVQHWQNAEGDTEAFSQVLEDLRDAGTQFVLDEFDLGLGEMGDIAAHGQFELRDDIAFTSPGNSVGDYLQGELTIQDMPAMLMLPLSGLVSGELPWILELREGNLTVNGEPLELP